MDAGLYIVPTPLGNLADISSRSIDVLATAHIILAEDTRNTRHLLNNLKIKIPRLQSYHDHSEKRAVEMVISKICSGQIVALVSDAGTPLISDPGYRLVVAAHLAKCKVIPIPGPCAAITALSASGLPTDRFHFEGFLPEKTAARKRRLRALCKERSTLIFYEAPHRLLNTLSDCIEIFGGNRRSFFARELTKIHETLLPLTLSELHILVQGDANQTRGELVLLVAGSRDTSFSLSPELTILAEKLCQDLSKKRVSVLISEYSGLPRKQIYNYLLNSVAS